VRTEIINLLLKNVPSASGMRYHLSAFQEKRSHFDVAQVHPSHPIDGAMVVPKSPPQYSSSVPLSRSWLLLKR